MPLTNWNRRPDLTRELVETYGWAPDADYPDMIWRKGDCTFTLVDREGRSLLENRKTDREWRFGRREPVADILVACARATACQEHGTSCQPGDHTGPQAEKRP